MREILFRGKPVDQDRFVYGKYFKTPLTDENSGIPPESGWFFLSDGETRHCIATEDGAVFVVEPETVTEYVGLEDIITNEYLFEGDVMRDSQGNRAELMFESGSFQLQCLGDRMLIEEPVKIGNKFNIPELEPPRKVATSKPGH